MPDAQKRRIWHGYDLIKIEWERLRPGDNLNAKAGSSMKTKVELASVTQNALIHSVTVWMKPFHACSSFVPFSWDIRAKT